MLNKALKFISVIGLTVLALGIFAMPVGAVAPNILDIDFENTPLFSNTNIMPGDEVIRYVEVTNLTTDSSYTIATQAENVVNSDGLGDVMDLTIFDHDNPGTIFYTGTLTQFFADGVVELSTLAPGQSIKYDYKIYFQYTADNTYQGKTLGFDIIVGDGDSESTGGETGGGGGGGGGGGYTHHNLIITDEALAVVGTTQATITWHTRDQATSNPLNATSRVIYDTVSHPNLSGCVSPNYCYAFSNTEDPTLVFAHSMDITGLASNTTYYFRPVSHASPEKTGIELSFTTNDEGQPFEYDDQEGGGGQTGGGGNQDNNADGNQTTSATPPTSGGTTPAGAVAGEQATADNQSSAPPANISDNQPQVKGAEANLSCATCPWWVWLLVAILHLWSVFTYGLFRNDDQLTPATEGSLEKPADNKKTYLWAWYLLVVFSLIIIYLLLTLICKLPAVILAIILLAYLTVLGLHYFIKVKQLQGLWSLVPVLLALGPIMTYFFSGSWFWWLWLVVLALYILSIMAYYYSIYTQAGRFKWWQALLFLALLTLVLEYILHLYLPCLGT